VELVFSSAMQVSTVDAMAPDGGEYMARSPPLPSFFFFPRTPGFLLWQGNRFSDIWRRFSSGGSVRLPPFFSPFFVRKLLEWRKRMLLREPFGGFAAGRTSRAGGGLSPPPVCPMMVSVGHGGKFSADGSCGFFPPFLPLEILIAPAGDAA